jgi:hypothetical protein
MSTKVFCDKWPAIISEVHYNNTHQLQCHHNQGNPQETCHDGYFDPSTLHPCLLKKTLLHSSFLVALLEISLLEEKIGVSTLLFQVSCALERVQYDKLCDCL